jgi:group I intron endonuclease
MGYIYSITNTIDGKKYIGQTVEKDVCNRWKCHFKKDSNCRYLKHAFEKYGKENFKFKVICICFDNDCDRYEKEYMERFNTLVPNGYNLRAAGNHGHHNEETKKKIGESLKERYCNLSDEEKIKYREICILRNTGRKHTEEAKQKISIFTKRRMKKINCYLLDGELLCTFNSLGDASREVNGGAANIRKCCKGKYKQSYGFIWKYANEI